MGRPETPLDARDGPLAEFACSLRRLRAEAGGQSYRQLARTANFGASTLARAAAGHTLPSWDVTRAFVLACGGDPRQWRTAWARAAGQAGRLGGAPGAAVHQLPADLRDFTGRAVECDSIREAARSRAAATGAPLLVVISGVGGVGKTALAVHAAHQLIPAFPDGQLFADLRGHDDAPLAPAQVATRFLAELGGRAAIQADPVTSLRSMTAGKRLLMVLDNAADEAQVAPLLPGSAACLVIMTSRSTLGMLPSDLAVRLDALDREDAVELLTRITGPQPAWHSAELASLAELCGRLPLALRIAGSRLSGDPPGTVEWLVDRLRDDNHRLRYLTLGELDLSAVFGVSVLSLPQLPRRVFHAAGLFPGPDFTAPALAVLAGMTAVDMECALERLIDESLVQRASPGRYRIHDLLGVYARRCAEADDAMNIPDCIRRLAEWYIGIMDAADRMTLPARGRPAPYRAASAPAAWAQSGCSPDAESVSAWFDAEEANLVAATRAAARHRHHDLAWRLPVAMRGLLEMRGHIQDWIAVHMIGWDSARAAGDPAAEGWILNGLATAYWRRHDHDEAISHYRRALDIRTTINDERGVAVVLNNLGSVYGAAGRYIEAAECLRKALAIRDKLGDELDRSYALHNLGHIQHEQRQFSQALPLLAEALQIRRQLGDPNAQAVTLHCLGDTLTGLRRYSEALGCLRTALTVFRHRGNRYGEAVAFHSIGSACVAMGRPDRAAHYLRSAISRYAELGQTIEQESATRELAGMTDR